MPENQKLLLSPQCSERGPWEKTGGRPGSKPSLELQTVEVLREMELWGEERMDPHDIGEGKGRDPEGPGPSADLTLAFAIQVSVSYGLSFTSTEISLYSLHCQLLCLISISLAL